MKEKNKYYTPEVEEFHVGFEYEWQEEKGQKWTKEVTPNEISLEGYDEQKDRVRVKHLDREDIESFNKTGFEEIKFEYDNNVEPIPARHGTNELPDGYYLDDQLDTGELWILYHYKSDGMVWIEYVKDCGGEGYLFKGIIKNKSELRRVLKMIGV